MKETVTFPQIPTMSDYGLHYRNSDPYSLENVMMQYLNDTVEAIKNGESTDSDIFSFEEIRSRVEAARAKSKEGAGEF